MPKDETDTATPEVETEVDADTDGAEADAFKAAADEQEASMADEPDKGEDDAKDDGKGKGEDEESDDAGAKPDDDEDDGPAAKRLAELADATDEAPAARPAAKPDDDTEKPAAKPAAQAKPAAKADDDTVLEWEDPDTHETVKRPVAEWEKEFSDFAGYVAHKAAAIADERIAATREQSDQLEQRLVGMQFDFQLSKKYPDWRDHATENSDFRKWLATRPDSQKQLYQSGGVPGATALLDAFTEHRDAAQRKADAAAEKAKKEKARKDGLHGDSLAGATSRSVDDDGTSDAADEFNKEAARLEREERRAKPI
jgi:hypothetical protein